MPSDIKEKLENTAEKAIVFALTPIEPILTYLFAGRLHVQREIARNLLVSSEWTEIIPQPSMKIKRNFQEILLYIDDYKWNTKAPIEETPEGRKPDLSKIILLDGTILNPEIQIIDQYGNKYDLDFSYSGKAVALLKANPLSYQKTEITQN